MLSFEQIKELIELVARHRLGGVGLERSGFKLSISGQEQAAPASHQGNGPQPSASQPGAAPHLLPTTSTAAPVSAAAASPPATPVEVAIDAHLVRSPIVGTFYAAPAPDAEPFVRAGDRVRKGQVVCIVEAMKLMNEIESDADGTVAQVLVRNGQPVEYGEPLFAVRAE
jgi:acetyl-CoA carboxylase biotin carboxyl carrier protein